MGSKIRFSFLIFAASFAVAFPANAKKMRKNLDYQNMCSQGKENNIDPSAKRFLEDKDVVFVGGLGADMEEGLIGQAVNYFGGGKNTRALADFVNSACSQSQANSRKMSSSRSGPGPISQDDPCYERAKSLNIMTGNTHKQNAKRLCDGMKKHIEQASHKIDPKTGLPRRVVMVAHSAAGPASKLMVTMCPEVFEQIAAVSCVQCAQGGSPLAEVNGNFNAEAVKKAQTYDRVKNQTPAQALMNGIKMKVGPYFAGATGTGLAPAQIEKEVNGPFRAFASSNQDLIEKIKKKFFFTTSSKRNTQNKDFAMESAIIDAAGAGKNDGALPVSSQMDDQLGRQLMHVDNASHYDLFSAGDRNRGCKLEFANQMFARLSQAVPRDDSGVGPSAIVSIRKQAVR